MTFVSLFTLDLTMLILNFSSFLPDNAREIYLFIFFFGLSDWRRILLRDLKQTQTESINDVASLSHVLLRFPRPKVNVFDIPSILIRFFLVSAVRYFLSLLNLLINFFFFNQYAVPIIYSNWLLISMEFTRCKQLNQMTIVIKITISLVGYKVIYEYQFYQFKLELIFIYSS